MNEIKLQFEKSVSNLAGFSFGENTFIKQVKKIIKDKNEEMTVIVFPNQIDDIAISFIQGFYEGIIKEIGYNNAKKLIIVQSENENEETRRHLLEKIEASI